MIELYQRYNYIIRYIISKHKYVISEWEVNVIGILFITQERPWLRSSWLSPWQEEIRFTSGGNPNALETGPCGSRQVRRCRGTIPTSDTRWHVTTDLDGVSRWWLKHKWVNRPGTRKAEEVYTTKRTSAVDWQPPRAIGSWTVSTQSAYPPTYDVFPHEVINGGVA
jgi:hypothetical protein